MPELPEVEVTRKGISPHLIGHTVTALIVRNSKLRWPVPTIAHNIVGGTITAIHRRAKYLLIDTEAGTTIIHLGMSGSLRVLPRSTPPGKHDHIDLVLSSDKLLRYNDPRRFGAWLWSELPTQIHPLLVKLGPEPLEDEFNAGYLAVALANRKRPIKLSLMDNHTVVGVGNIYANEALFAAGIHPNTESGSIDIEQLNTLVMHVKRILTTAIEQGGTTLKDFTNADGKPGYFAQELFVYGRGQQPCKECGHLLTEIKLGQRTTVFCGICQPR